jgi:hypothetical protein
MSRKPYKHWGLRRIRTARDTQLRGKCYKHRGLRRRRTARDTKFRGTRCKHRGAIVQTTRHGQTISSKRYKQRGLRRVRVARFLRMSGKPCNYRLAGDPAIPSPTQNIPDAQKTLQIPRFWRSCHPLPNTEYPACAENTAAHAFLEIVRSPPPHKISNMRRKHCKSPVLGDRAIPYPTGNTEHAQKTLQGGYLRTESRVLGDRTIHSHHTVYPTCAENRGNNACLDATSIAPHPLPPTQCPHKGQKRLQSPRFCRAPPPPPTQCPQTAWFGGTLCGGRGAMVFELTRFLN